MAPAPAAIGLTLCDYVIVEQGTNKISIIGSFTRLRLSPFPAIASPFSVCALLTGGLGDITMELKVTRLDTGAETAVHRKQLHFPNKLAEVLYRPRLPKVVFPVPG